jgi:uncharacterized protein YecT (DUF1311 family)
MSSSLCVRTVLSTVLCLLGLPACAQPARADPRALVGTWDVDRVAVDRADQSHWQYFPNDPRLLGRELRVTLSELALNNGSLPCQVARLTGQQQTLEALIGRSFPRSPRPDTPAKPTPEDFGLHGLGNLTAFAVACSRPASPWSDTWLVAANADTLLMRYGASVLSLKRRAESVQAAPSFACSRAANDAEHTICSSPSLAGFDRSIAAAYRRAASLGGANPAALKTEQAEWLETRNRCGKDNACLEQSMRERIEELMQE